MPTAEIAFDPFHVVRLGQRAVDQVRRDEWNAHERSHTPTGRWIKNTRWSLLKAPAKQSISQLAVLGEVQQANKAMFRAFLLKEELRLLYALEDPALAPAHLDAWLAWASRSRLQPFIRLASTIRRHRAGILAAIRLGLSNATPGRPQQPHPADQPSQLRLPLRQPARSRSSTSAAPTSSSTSLDEIHHQINRSAYYEQQHSGRFRHVAALSHAIDGPLDADTLRCCTSPTRATTRCLRARRSSS